MTRINEYLWQLPHTPSFDDPPDVVELMQRFNGPIAAGLEGSLVELGYTLKSNDIAVRLDSPPVQLPIETTEPYHTYIANVRFMKYLQNDVITRIHIEHVDWAHVFAHKEVHRYYVNLDRFKLADPQTQVVIASWSGRLHTRMSNRPGEVLHHDGEDQIWAYSSAEQLEQQLQLIVYKFIRLGKLWLEDYATFEG